MAHLQINCADGHGDVYAPGQLFVFGSMVFCADSMGHLTSVENYAPGWIVTFGGLEYTTDSRGELILSGWTPGRIESSAGPGGSTPEPNSVTASLETPDAATPAGLSPITSSEVDPAPTPEIAPVPELILAQNPKLCSDSLRPENASGYTPGVLRISPAYGASMNPEELSHLDEMLEHIRSMSISDGKTSVYNQIRLKADDREIYISININRSRT